MSFLLYINNISIFIYNKIKKYSYFSNGKFYEENGADIFIHLLVNKS